MGEGPAENKLKKLVVKLGLGDNVLFVGYQDRNGELNDCYSCGDIFVFASRTETQGLVLLESMALGVPVVSTSVMGTRDILESGQGSLIADEDERKFARKVSKLLTNTILRNRLASEAQQYAQQWSADSLAIRMLELYSLICKQYDTADGKMVFQTNLLKAENQDQY